MEQGYNIKGIEKIINKVGKERLARYYGVGIDADFESIITNNFREHNIPAGLEVALYFSVGPEEYNKAMEDGKDRITEQAAALEVYKKDGGQRAMFGFTYINDTPEFDGSNWTRMTGGSWGNVLYFFVDKPIKIEDVGDLMYSPRYMVGGVQYHGLLMGNAYYEAHKDELESAYPDRSNIKVLEDYLESFVQEFKSVDTEEGHGTRIENEETAHNERIILELTGKSSIDEVSLQDLISVKRKLEERHEELKKDLKANLQEKIMEKKYR